jgi:hypothetical protein
MRPRIPNNIPSEELPKSIASNCHIRGLLERHRRGLDVGTYANMLPFVVGQFQWTRMLGRLQSAANTQLVAHQHRMGLRKRPRSTAAVQSA